MTYTNKPVAQPDLWVSFPAGNASIAGGGWPNIELGKYDDPDDDFSESGGLSAFNVAEFNPNAEVSFPVGRTAITGGIVRYLFPNDLDDAPNGGLDSELNTWEVYGTPWASRTQFRSLSSEGSDFKIWGGVSIGWSNAVEKDAEE